MGVTQVGALVPFDCSTWPVEPVEPDSANVPLKSIVVNFPDAAVVAPIDILLIVPRFVGAISTDPEPVGLM